MLADIKLLRDGGTPLYIQLYEQLRDCIQDGLIQEDEKLPPIRQLAAQLDVNSVTVVNAYKLLEENKLIYKKVGSGSYVMPLREKINLDASSDEEELEPELAAGEDGELINLATANPDPKLFPVADFKRVVNEVLERDGGNAFLYLESKGYRPLREAIHAYMQKLQMTVNLEDIYIISGAQQGIDIISRVLLANGDYVFVESPTYNGAVAAFKSRGAKIVEIPLMADGLDVKALEKMLKLMKPKCIYVMPSFQNPTGCTYSERKRKHLLLLCRKYDVLVLEDDYLSELSYLEDGIKPLKAYDREDRVIYIKSFSKIFMPGLRVGYLVIPDNIRERVMSVKYMTDISTSGFMQRVLSVYLRSSFWEKHIESMKREYSLRYIETIRIAKKALRGASFQQPYGGLNLWIRLPEGVYATALAEGCKARGVLITPGTVFLKGEEGERYFRLSFAGETIERITAGVTVIGEVMERLKLKE